MRSIAWGALVEGHHNICTDGALSVDDALGGEEVARTVDVRLEVATLLLELAACCQRKYLKATTVGKHGLCPRREAMHASRLFQNTHSWAKI